MESWDGTEDSISPIGPNKKGVFATEAEAEAAIAIRLDLFVAESLTMWIKKRFIIKETAN